ncbi:DNA repair exonuclease subunit 1 protein [Rhizobium phage RHph_Y68]|uniref:DNA repair exonuclease subunit 1 protein n=1 Tax=Rhizobium phage RHph_Y68 TaxID=2509787 RepID=A0A7S5QYC4_9CAUD|nr:DNA repair exonuclease subunit 1 protein [Rhizobium phage RHph_Y68]QIG68090.1 DNA repair exonuclease subunit 1 protein [Rhizobium phage RHph_Y68]
MTDVFITGGFRLGRTNQNVDLVAELDKYVDWLCKQAESNLSLDGVSLVVAGNFFDTKRALTISQYHKANEIINKLDNTFEMVFFLVGDRDIPGRKNEGETLYDFFEFGHADIHIIKKFTRIPVDGRYVYLFPFGETGENEKITSNDVIVSCNDTNARPGSPFQMSWEDSDIQGGYFHVTETTCDSVSYPRKIFRKINLNDNKIEGKNPVKWLSDNKKELEGACLEVVVALDTDKTLYSKFVGVLGTVKLADVKLTETFSFTSDKPMSSSRPDFAESLKPLIDREGAKTKLEAIIAKLGG